MAKSEPQAISPDHCFDTVVTGEDESEHFDPAVYIDRERRPRHVPHVGLLIRSCRGDSGNRKRVARWSAKAAQDFGQYWRSFRRARGPLPY